MLEIEGPVSKLKNASAGQGAFSSAGWKEDKSLPNREEL